MEKVQQSSKAACGTITNDYTTMHLLKANVFAAENIRNRMAEKHIPLINVTSSGSSGKTPILQEDAPRIDGKVKEKKAAKQEVSI